MPDAPIEDWWTPVQLECATDTSRNWRHVLFQPRDMVVEPIDSGWLGHKRDNHEETTPNGKIIQNGWDHEHCFLCWATISTATGDCNAGYTDGNDWVCDTCFAKYIAPRKIT
jgi:hypothetical protein